MARKIEAVLTLKDNFSKKLESISSNADKQAKEIQSKFAVASKNIQKVGKTLENTGKKLTAGVTVPLVGAATAAVSNYAEVDKTMSLVNATMGNSADEAKMLTKAMGDAASNSVFGMSDAAEAALNFARGGWDATQAANALAPAMNLAAGEGGDLETVSAGLMATMNSFGADADEAASYADVFANACNNSALDVDSLADSMSIAAPVFAANGRSVEDAAVAMGTMAQAGIDANVAATSLKSGLLRMASNDAAQKKLDELGVSIFDESGKMKDMVTIQGDLSRAFSGLSDAERDEAAAKVFGINQSANWLAMLQQSTDWVGQFSEQISESGTTAEMAEAMMGGFGGSIERLKSSIDVLADSFGETLAPYVQKAVDIVQNITDKFQNLSPEQKDLVVRIGMIAAAIGPALLIAGKIISTVGMVIGTVGKVISIASKVQTVITAVGAVLGVPLGPILAIVAAVVVLGIVVAKHWDQIKEFTQSMIDAIKAKFEELKEKFEFVKQTFRENIDAIKQKFEDLKAKIHEKIELIKQKFEELRASIHEKIELIKQKFEEFRANVQEKIDAVKGFFEDLKSKVESVFGDIGSAIMDKLSEPFKWIQDKIDTLKGAFAGLKSDAEGAATTTPSTRPGANAAGTSYWTGGRTWVGENGPELVDLPSGSKVYPHTKSDNMSATQGGINVAVNIQGNIIGDKDYADYIGEQVAGALIAAMAN